MHIHQPSGTLCGLLFRIVPLFLAVILLLSSCSSSGQTWQDQYDLGVRYLEDGDYENAILAFTAAIEIDPKQAAAFAGRGDALTGMAKKAAGDVTDPTNLPEEAKEAYKNAIEDYKEAIRLDASVSKCYLGAAEAYQALGQDEEAVSILTEGHEATGDESLLTLAQQIQGVEAPNQDSEENTEQNPQQTPEQKPEETPEPEPTQTPEENQTKTPEQTPEQTQEPEPEPEPEPQPAPAPAQPTATDPATAYTDFLNHDGWEAAIGADAVQEIMDESPRIRSCLVDLDGDGTKELFIDAAGELSYNMSSNVAVLDIENGNVVVRTSAQNQQGNDLSDDTSLKYDTQEQKPVLVHEVYEDMGMTYGEMQSMIVYDQSMQNEAYRIESVLYEDLEGSATEIAQIKSETNLYTEEDYRFCVYRLNGQYISEQDYNAWMARFQDPTDPAYQLKNASMSQPVVP